MPDASLTVNELPPRPRPGTAGRAGSGPWLSAVTDTVTGSGCGDTTGSQKLKSTYVSGV